jgi:hypothetical protein
MSWSIHLIGEPDAVLEALNKGYESVPQPLKDTVALFAQGTGSEKGALIVKSSGHHGGGLFGGNVYEFSITPIDRAQILKVTHPPEPPAGAETPTPETP